MNQINRYLFTQLLLSVFFACLAVTMVVWFSQSVRMLSLVMNNGGSLWAFLKLMVLLLPTFLPLLLPISLVVGTLFVFHRLTSESELVVMQAVGMSPLDITKPALILGFLVAGLGYFLSIMVAPTANHELVKLQYQIRNDHSVLLLRTGSFNDIAEGLTFYARDRGKDGQLQGILLHDTRKPEKPVTIMAEGGELVRTAEGPKILIHDGMRQEVEKATGILSQLTFETYLVDLGALGDNFTTRWREPRERTMVELLNPQGTDIHPVTMARFLAEFHMRLTMPFIAVTFVLIACVFMLTGSFDRRGMNQKIVLATCLVVFLEALMLTVMQMISKQAWMIVVLYIITFAPLPFLLYRLAAVKAPRPAPRKFVEAT